MKAKFVNESLNEQDYLEKDDFYASDEEDDIENVEVKDSPFDVVRDLTDDDDEEEMIVQDEFETALNNELKVPEYARRTVSFKVKGEPGVIDGIPMAKMKDGSFLMKIGNKYRKIKISDIIEESLKVNRK